MTSAPRSAACRRRPAPRTGRAGVRAGVRGRRAAAVIASSKLSASPIARATSYCTWSLAASRSRPARRRAITTASAPPAATTPIATRCRHLEEGVRDEPERDRDHERDYGHHDGLARGGAGRRDQRAGDEQLDEHGPGAEGGVYHRHDRQREQPKRERAPFPGRVPRIRLRAQLGREYSATNLGVPADEQHPEGVVRVRADNPSPLTLDGTNTYVVGRVGRGSRPGRPRPPGRRAAGRGGGIEGVVLTHSHADHSEGAEELGAPVSCRWRGGGRPIPSDGDARATPRTASAC